MIEKFGRKGTEVRGVFFTEGQIDGGDLLGEATTSSDRQNIALDILKEKIADQVLAKGGNALDNFKYVQKGSSFSFSSTRWVLTGRILKV